MITLTTYAWVPDFAAPLMRAFRVRWALEEAGLPYNVRTVALGPEQRSPEHLARQPFGQAPAIEEDGLVLFESGAIALYIGGEEREAAAARPHRNANARPHGYLPRSIRSRSGSCNWRSSISSMRRKNGRRSAGRKSRSSCAIAWDSSRTRSARKTISKGEFTVGDLMMADVLRILDHTDMFEDYPRLNAYKRRCAARPAFQRAMQAQLDGFKKAA